MGKKLLKLTEEEKVLKKVTNELIVGLEEIFVIGITEENIEEGKKYLADNYKKYLPQEYHGNYIPFLGIQESKEKLYIGWRNISKLS